MATAILEICHGYFRIAAFKDGSAMIIPDKYGNNKTPARIYLQEGVSAVGYNPKWGEGTVRVDNICDSSALLSDCVAQIRNSKISGREIAEKLLGHVASTAGAFLYDVIDTIAVIVPNSYVKENYVLVEAGKAIGIDIRIVRGVEALGYVYATTMPPVTNDDEPLYVIHLGYDGIDRCVFEYGNDVLEQKAISSLKSSYIENFLERISIKIVSAVLEDRGLIGVEDYATVCKNAVIEAQKIAKKPASVVPICLSYKALLGHRIDKSASGIMITDQMLADCARRACNDVLPSIEPLKSGLDSTGFPDEVIVSGEATDYPFLLLALMDRIREEGFSPILSRTSEIEAIASYFGVGDHLILTVTGNAFSLLTSYDTSESIFLQTDSVPTKCVFKIDVRQRERVGLVIVCGDTPVLWGIVAIPAHTETISASVELDSSRLVTGWVQVNENTKIPLQNEDAALPEAMSLLPGKNEVNIRNRNKRMNFFTSNRNKDEADEIKPSPAPEPEPMECPRDELFPEAVELVFASGEGSISALQREFRISYGHANEIIDQMEKAGLLSEYNGRSRELLMTRKQWEEKVNHSCSPD